MRAAEVRACLDLFCSLATAHAAADTVLERSAHDKEFAAEDWVARAARETGLTPIPQGRHAPVDFALTGTVPLAVQVKGLTRRSGAVRTTLDYNGTLPQPRHDDAPVLLVYTELDKDSGTGHRARSLVVADMSLIQDDVSAAQSRSIAGHGSYGDMLARLRLMYVGAQPVAFAKAQGLDVTGYATLILPAGSLPADAASDAGLAHAGQLRREYATRRLVSAQVFFDGRDPEPVWEPVPPRPARRFDVWTPTVGPDGEPLPLPARCVPPPADTAGPAQLTFDF